MSLAVELYDMYMMSLAEGPPVQNCAYYVDYEAGTGLSSHNIWRLITFDDCCCIFMPCLVV